MNYITWLYFLVENQGKKNQKVIFLYGLSLPTYNKISKTEISSDKINNKKSIVKFTTISKKLIERDNGLLDFKGFISSEEKKCNIIHQKNIIQVAGDINYDIPRSILTTPLYTECLYTEDFFKYYEDLETQNKKITSLIEILNHLENMSGQKFSRAYLKRLGCYEIGKTQEWTENILTPFVVTSTNNNDGLECYYFDVIDNSYKLEDITVHLIVYNNDREIISDTVKVIKDFSFTFLSEVPTEDNFSYEYWVFNSQGRLIDRNKLSFIQEVALRGSISSGSYQIPKKTHSNKSPLSDKDRTIDTYTKGFKNNIEFQKNPEIEQKYNVLYDEVLNYYEEQNIYTNGLWLKFGEHDKIIEFLNFISSNSSYEITFIDPFISSSASIDYFYHFENLNISIKFISCWEANLSPDYIEQSNETSINELITNFDNIQDFNIPLKSATWYDLKNKKFHDRFIYIVDKETNEKTVYSVSNSLNNLLKTEKYDLLIVPLKGNVLLDAIAYIDNLILQCDDSKKIYPRGNV
jgi:hypothetical protein